MKKSVAFLFLIYLTFSCTKRNELPLKERIENFKISECQKQCGVDSIGVRTNKIINGDLSVRLGYIVNCSWKYGFIKEIYQRNDSLYVALDRPHKIDTTKISDTEVHIEEMYPITDCDCFFFFDFKLTDYQKAPKIIRVVELFDKNKFWDERESREIFEIEETIIELE